MVNEEEQKPIIKQSTEMTQLRVSKKLLSALRPFQEHPIRTYEDVIWMLLAKNEK